MTVLREFAKVENGMIQIKVPDDFKNKEVEVIIMLKSNPMEEIDPYFEERKKHIAKTIGDIENGKMKIYLNEEFEKEMDKFEQELILKYEN